MFRAAALSLAFLMAGCTAAPAPSPLSRERDPQGVLVHLFEWPWPDVTRECTEVLGPAGIAGVQISPPQEHIAGPQWWVKYQPTSYQIVDRGNFAEMVKQCHSAGVKIYADAVINHRRGGQGAHPAARQHRGSAKGELQGRDNPEDFHHCGHSIANYQDRVEVQTCDLVGLPDLATEKPEVRQQLADRLTDLLPSEGSVVYVDSHDSQRGTSTLSYKEEERHTLAVQFMLAYPYGTPLVMSSFAFENFDDGPPTTQAGWVCEHRLVMPMVKWRDAMGNVPLEKWWATDNQLGFARKGKGYFALNRASTPVTRAVDIEPGRYRDVISGNTLEISTAVTIPAAGAVALIKENS